MKDFPFDAYDFFGYIGAGLVILIGLEITLGVPQIIGKDLKTLELAIVMLSSYVVGQIAATPASALFEMLIIGKVLGPPSVNLMRKQQTNWARFFFPGYFKALPETTQLRIQTKAQAEGLATHSGESLFVHIRFRDYIRNDAVLMARLSTFLNKYGFSRNLSFVALMFCCGVLALTPFDPKTETTKYALIVGCAAIFLFYRYLKFYRQYSYELFNSYAGR